MGWFGTPHLGNDMNCDISPKMKRIKFSTDASGFAPIQRIYTSQLSYISTIHITDYIPWDTGEFATPRAVWILCVL